jgi:small subunit ribosomal protein S6
VVTIHPMTSVDRLPQTAHCQLPIEIEEPALPVNTYEGMFLLDSSKVAVNWDDSVQHVHDILTKHKSEIVASRQWDERRLAYPVEGHKKGTYLLTYFKTEGAELKDIVSDCHLSDVIVRELILKVHPKLADHLVNQAMTSTPSVEGEDSPRDEEPDERPRRRRRDE